MKIAIVGGTHGNEKTGAYLVNKWQSHTEWLPPYHEYKLCIGNPIALKENKRYLDSDLNRSFNNTSSAACTHYETQRANEIKKDIEEWAQGLPFFLIDLHTTTSNMGATCVLSKNDRFTAYVLAELQKENNIHVLFNSDFDESCVFVDSIAPHGLIVEVGPVPQNVFDAKIIKITENLVLTILNIIHQLEHKALTSPVTLKGYQEYKTIHFPDLENHLISTVVHPNLIGKDYQCLKPREAIFQQMNGEPLFNSESEDSYPVFINESAYLDKNIAFLLTKMISRKF